MTLSFVFLAKNQLHSRLFFLWRCSQFASVRIVPRESTTLVIFKSLGSFFFFSKNVSMCLCCHARYIDLVCTLDGTNQKNITRLLHIIMFFEKIHFFLLFFILGLTFSFLIVVTFNVNLFRDLFFFFDNWKKENELILFANYILWFDILIF